MDKNQSPAPAQQVDLVLANTVSRLGCSLAEARAYLARNTAAASPSPAPKTPLPPASKISADEALL